MPAATNTIPEAEESLVTSIKESDGSAFKNLCQIYYDPLYRFLWRKTRNINTAQDLVQELFMNIWKSRQTLDPSKSIKAYLYKSANNLAINHLKKKAVKDTHFADSVELESAVSSESAREFREYIDDALYDIPENQRLVFELNKFEGLKYAEIAEMLQVSIKTVESRMSSTLKTLREKLKHLLGFVIFLKFVLKWIGFPEV